MAEAFSKNNFYIALKDDIDGNSALLFAIQLFYEKKLTEKRTYSIFSTIIQTNK